MARRARKFPNYDAAVDGNPFHWILQTSARLRQEQRAQLRARSPVPSAGKKK